MTSAYISGPLQGSADLPAARRFYERIALVCRQCDVEPYVPHLNTDPDHNADVSPESVFERDLNAMRGADIVVAHIGAPSSGVGAELAFAVQAAQPIVAIWRSGERPSRFILGMLLAYPGARLCSFDGEDALEPKLIASLSELSEAPTGHRGRAKRRRATFASV